MSNFQWLLASIFLFVLSAIVSWFMPNGVNLISQLFGQEVYPITPLIRLFSFMFSFLFLIGIEVIIWVRVEIGNFKKEIPFLLTNKIILSTREVVDNAILKLFVNSLKDRPQNIKAIHKILEEFANPLIELPSEVLDSYLIVIEGFARRFNEYIKNLGQDGCHVNLREHLETTKWLAAKSQTYLQIQRKAFKAPDEWTNQWCQLLDWLQKRRISCEYIVLMDRESLENEKEKIQSMNMYLSQRGFIFKYCILEDVEDSLGGTLPTEENIEVFNNKIVKLQAIPIGGYKGGITIKMTLFDINTRDKIRRLVNYVTDFAEKC
ncbi:hypothetical protein IQ249_11555 [Lusitaniella coriacea LEGE 07157]|uniref:Uncharacterized protein n=1 Tax=Lusitaniella coriacea LEGE 07157 TaxID=945747 RepID=A0A8J7JAX4_9CYAN|nr:hypothetical protein [Lusitaniella coriacea]MBE9116535.1 hypothetical protein [Lusitaniella coriacea LEGE 07157]